MKRLIAMMLFVFTIAPASIAHAEPKLEDVFKSTQQNFEKETDARMLMAIVAAGIAIVILISVVHRYMQRAAKPKVLNHQGKLLKELQKAINLKPGELRQLKSIADAKQIENPMTLLLCPSLLRPKSNRKSLR